MKVALVGGARPNFMKIAPLLRAIHKFEKEHGKLFEPLLIHTGQHYDYEMSKVFFEDLELPEPDIYLDVGSGGHAKQTGKIMIEFEKMLFQEKPDLVVVVGDVNSTLAAALTTAKLNIPIAHVEAGLRSFDRTMPEEQNRLLTDAISDYLFTPSPDADDNLKHEGIAQEKISLVGDVMVDSLLYHKPKAEHSQILNQLNLAGKDYTLLTLHRPSNVDEKDSLFKIMKALEEISQRIPIVFPAHPRTQKRFKEFGLPDQTAATSQRLLIIPPVGYLDFLKLEMNARFVMTDSGGIQEETTVLSIPCLTLRDTTERPITITQGTNILVWNETQKIIEEAFKILDGQGKQGTYLPIWDGKTAERIIEVLSQKGTKI